jgi:hypothetical protein
MGKELIIGANPDCFVACVHEFIKFLSELAVFAQSQLWLAICIQNVLIFTKIISFIHATHASLVWYRCRFACGLVPT